MSLPMDKNYDNTQELKETLRLDIGGMSCTSCSSAIERMLNKQDSIYKANVFLLSNSAVVIFNPRMITIDGIITLIQNIGYKAEIQKTPLVFNTKVQPMSSVLKPTFNKPNPQDIKPLYHTQKKHNDCNSMTTRNDIKRDMKCFPEMQNMEMQNMVQDSCCLSKQDTKQCQNVVNDIAIQNHNNQAVPCNMSHHHLIDSTNEDNNATLYCQNFQQIDKPNQTIFSHSPYKTYMRFFNNIKPMISNQKIKLIISLLLSCIVVYISMLHDMFHVPLPQVFDDLRFNAILQFIITLCVMYLGGIFYVRGLKNLFYGNPNMDSLVALGSLSGFLYSFYILVLGITNDDRTLLHNLYFEGVCVILSFIMLGKYIEESVKNKAMQNAKALVARKQEKAYKILNPNFLYDTASIPIKTEEVVPDSLQKGDYIQVLAHSFIPVDGILISEYAEIDESMLSGENLPIYKERQASLYAGTLNLQNSLIMQTTSTTQNSTLTKINHLIQQSYESKAKIAQLADRVSGFFVPIVIALAVLTGIFWFFYADLQTAMRFFASTLLISCPCALGLATPMAILFANARANKMGVFFKNAQSLENIAQCDYVVFDKTGTLTKRDFTLHSIDVFYNNDSESLITQDELLKICASIEYTNNHIIAQSICKYAKNLSLYHVRESQNILNQGIKARLDYISYNNHNMPTTFILGSYSFMLSNPLKNAEVLESQNNDLIGVHVYVAQLDERDNTYVLLGRITLGEELKEDSKMLIDTLKGNGMTCEILSGDSDKNVAYIANVLNVEYRAACKPEDKLSYIRNLQMNNHRVIMVGDGMNDAIAIAQADVSIVMATGSDVSIEYGDIIYFKETMQSIQDSITLGSRTLRNIKQNLSFAFLYNIICIPIAMGFCSGLGIVLSPMVASFAMSLSSISVVANAMRLYGFKSYNRIR